MVGNFIKEIHMKKLFTLFLLFAAWMPMVGQPKATLGAAQAPGSSFVSLSWTASTTVGSTVNVYRCAGASCTTFTKLTTGIVAAGPYSDTSVTAGAYSYYVTAVVNGVESAPSNTATVSVSPQPPTGLTATFQ